MMKKIEVFYEKIHISSVAFSNKEIELDWKIFITQQ